MKKKIKIVQLIDELENINHYGVEKALVQLKKEVSIYLACDNEIKNINEKIKQQLSIKNKIHVGGGKQYLKGFINIDLSKPADIIYDVRKNLPFPSESVDFIFSEHFLEHIDYPISVLNYFLEAYRILRKKGKLIIGVPDAGLITEAYVKKDKKILLRIKNEWYSKRSIINNIEAGIDIVNLVIKDEYADEKYNPHFWGYDELKLKNLFKKNNFKKIKKWKFDKNIANPKRKFGSIYIEGVKM